MSASPAPKSIDILGNLPADRERTTLRSPASAVVDLGMVCRLQDKYLKLGSCTRVFNL